VNKTHTGEQNQGSAPSAEAWSQDPFTTHIKFDGTSSVRPPFPTPSTFTITRLESTAGLHDRITRLSSVPALLVSICLKSLPLHSYQVWVADKLIPTHRSFLRFQSNVIDLDSEPSCWAGKAFDYVHYTMPRAELDDISADFGFGRVNSYRLSVVEDDLVLAQITRSILPFIGRRDGPSLLALDQFSLILGAHLLQRYGVLQKMGKVSKGGLAPWQKRRAAELLRENLDGRIRLTDVARECSLSVSHFARSFRRSFGTSAHRYLILHRVEIAKALLSETNSSLVEIAAQTGFSDQAALTRTFANVVGATPGKWRREHSRRSIFFEISNRKSLQPHE
jgi:AraC family transcriptional regulator